MKRYFTYFFLFAAIVLTGCEGALAPMGSSDEVKLDERLLGTWIGVGDNEDDVTVMTISAINDFEYAITYREEGEEEDETLSLRAFTSLVGGIQFANITCLSCEEDTEDEEDWLFFAFELESNDALVATAINNDVYNEGLSELTETDQVRAYILSHLNDANFFEEDEGRFIRQAE